MEVGSYQAKRLDIFSEESKPYFRRKTPNEHLFLVISAVWKGNKNNRKRTILKELVGVMR